MATTQQTLTGDLPRDAGLWTRYVRDGHIDHGAWLRARASGEFVGTCRQCGDYLIPGPPETRSGRTDYTAACRNPDCWYEMNAPGGRVRRHGEHRGPRPGYHHRDTTREDSA